MSLGEVMVRVAFTFLAAFFAVIMGGYFLSLVLDFTYLQWTQRTIIAAFLIASLCCWTWFFAYSKIALCSRQMLLRYFAAYVTNIIIAFTVLEFSHRYFGWNQGIVIIYHLTTFLVVTITFVCIVAFSAWQARLVSNKFDQGLQQWQQCRAEEAARLKPSSKEVVED